MLFAPITGGSPQAKSFFIQQNESALTSEAPATAVTPAHEHTPAAPAHEHAPGTAAHEHAPGTAAHEHTPAAPAHEHAPGTPAHEHTPATAADGADPEHTDPFPPGVTAGSEVTVANLIQRAEVAKRPAIMRSSRLGSGVNTVAAVAPGRPGIPSLSSHVPFSCNGTGTDGKRVQAVYVYEAGTANRLNTYDSASGLTLKSALMSYLGDVNDTFALSSPSAQRRVRWVFDSATCLPTIPAIMLPAGSLARSDYGLAAIESAVTAAGLIPSNGSGGRKILSFADTSRICGIGQIFNDDSASLSNINNGDFTMVARVDRGCWAMSPGWHSTPAHELTHMLGGVQSSAPHATNRGHCVDESDLMCYADGGTTASGAVASMRTVCASTAQEALLDCNKDDYFNAGTPATGSYLASHWNTAKSSYLDVAAAAPKLATSPVVTTVNGVTVTLTGPTLLRAGLAGSARVSSSVAGGIRWSASDDRCLGSVRTLTYIAVQCPTNAPAQVTLTVTVTTADGRVASASLPFVTTGPAANLTVGFTAPTRVYAGSTIPVVGTVRYGSTPVRAAVVIQEYTNAGWITKTSTVLPSSGILSTSLTGSSSAGYRSYRMVVLQTSGSWAATVSPSRVVTRVYRTMLSISVTPGKPNAVRGYLRLSTGTPLANQVVLIQARRSGSTSWLNLTTRRTYSNGWLYVATQPRVPTEYRLVYLGTTTVSTGVSSAARVRY